MTTCVKARSKWHLRSVINEAAIALGARLSRVQA